MIHITQNTASQIAAFGKGHWISPRADQVIVKGFGAMSTFWLNPHAYRLDDAEIPSVSDDSEDDDGDEGKNESIDGEGATNESDDESDHARIKPKRFFSKKDRLTDWLYELLHIRIRSVVAKRKALGAEMSSAEAISPMVYIPDIGQTPANEFKESINLQKVTRTKSVHEFVPLSLGRDVEMELRLFAETISSLYTNHEFHNFEHACHVTMSVNKLLSRIVAVNDTRWRISDDGNTPSSNDIEFINSVNSNPITLLGIVFAAVVHDVDHRGKFIQSTIFIVFSKEMI
jgi:3'5'-cyclic nucleotide phosphodiesterase